MFKFDVTKHVPRFILQDKNGYAVAKAIEAAVQIMNDIIQQGVDCVLNYDMMPEWRLDELAWETNCLYDYNADIETKREWIKNAIPLYSLFGTPQAVYQYIIGLFGDADIEENWNYGGAPYHFRVTVEGELTTEKEAWVKKAIETAKNVRSVLDDIAIGSGTTIIVSGEGGVLARYSPPMTGDGLYAGTYPEDSIIGRIADEFYVIVTRNTRGHIFPYPQAGTQPEETTVGGFVESRITAAPVAEGHVFPYPTTGVEAQAGTRPEVNTIGAIANRSAQAGTDGKATAFSYSPCTDENLCGSDEI